MAGYYSWTGWRWFAFASICAALLAAGCGGPRHPVAGRVLLEGQPLANVQGAVVLKPDASKGNKRKVLPIGVLNRDGSFSVVTDGKPGAPPGWYKVIVTANEPGANPNEDSPSLLNARYESETA